jgi:serine/threonine protein kinase
MEEGGLIGRYVVETCLVTGKHAAVYRCFDPELTRVVAVYYMHADASAEETALLLHNQRMLATLLHPNIVRTFDGGLWEGRRFSVMEFIDGGSLRDFIQDGVRVPWATTMRIGASIAGAMKYTHQRGIVNAEIRPLTIALRSTGEPIILELRQSALLSGEALAAANDRMARDLWSLCGTLLCLLLGRLRPWGTLEAVRPTFLAWLAEPGLPDYVVDVLARGIGAPGMPPYPDAGRMGSALRAVADQIDHEMGGNTTLSVPEAGETVILHVEHREEDRPGAYREYQLLEHLSDGAFGDVYRALDHHTKQPIALKILKRKWINDLSTVERFRREAMVMSELVHPNIVRVFNYGRYGDSVFMAMEYIDGPTLGEVMAHGPMADVIEAARIIKAVLLGLAASAEAGIVHRDVKPSNIKIAKDGVRLFDFGIAHMQTKDTLTETGAFIGTLRYASPEQVQGISIGPPSDVYSAGVMLYELLTGAHPQPVDGVATLMVAIVGTQPQAIGTLRAGVPTALEETLYAMLAKAPEARPTASEAAQRLDALLMTRGTRVEARK